MDKDNMIEVIVKVSPEDLEKLGWVRAEEKEKKEPSFKETLKSLRDYNWAVRKSILATLDKYSFYDERSTLSKEDTKLWGYIHSVESYLIEIEAAYNREAGDLYR